MKFKLLSEKFIINGKIKPYYSYVGKEIYYEIYKNPSLNELKRENGLSYNNVRGYIDYNGDLYIILNPEESTNPFLHYDILKILKKENLINNDIKENVVKFACPVTRILGSNKFGLPESYLFPTDQNEKNIEINLIKKYYELAKIKNPSLDFIIY